LRVDPPPPSEGDAYEVDNSCDQAQPIATGREVQVHTFHERADQDWVKFEAVQGTTYRIEVQPSTDSPADLTMELYDRCPTGLPTGNQNYFYSPGIRYELKSPITGSIYLYLRNSDANVYGAHVSYSLSVRALTDTPPTGAVIVVAGKIKQNDGLQSNIYHVTDAVYDMFMYYGYTQANIYYLAPSDKPKNGPKVDVEARRDTLRAAITEWAMDKVGPNQPLTIYLMDHGDPNTFYLDKEKNEWVSPEELNNWLTTLEQAKGNNLTVNLLIEACYSGSFIKSSIRVSKPGRIVVTSANSDRLAKASTQGAIFSDMFIQALKRKESLYSSFQLAQAAAEESNPNQGALLDGDGDGKPNEPEDYRMAAERGFGRVGFADAWPPYIVKAGGPSLIKQGHGEIWAEVQDDTKVKQVRAIIYPPSYQPPAQTGNEMIQETLTTFVLTDKGKGQFAVDYPAFTEKGLYRVVLYAEDEFGSEAQPLTITFPVDPLPTPTPTHAIYLPLIKK